jgi:hypothetical protein
VKSYLNRRVFLQSLAAAGTLEFTRLTPVAHALAKGQLSHAASEAGYTPGRIPNEYSLSSHRLSSLPFTLKASPCIPRRSFCA